MVYKLKVNTMKKKIAILGSTGSIGTQALEVIREHSDRYEAYVLTAGRNAELLVRQAREFLPDSVVIADESKYESVKADLADLPIKVYAGADALCEVVEAGPIDMVLTAMVGFAGLRPTVHALRARKPIALANKETLVVAGEVITRLAMEQRVPILPVDSEHSAIFQSVVGEGDNPVEKILLTASGGPFRKSSMADLQQVTCRQALQHPNWKMGAKITIDSATMMNKGFEMIEAKWLFGVPAEQIEVVVHPESVIHSAVQFCDGAVKAQLGVPDMRLPIQYAFTYPQRLSLSGDRLDLFQLGSLHFEPADMQKFRCLGLAYDAVKAGGNVPCILNAANEVANLAFREERLSFNGIAEVIAETMVRATKVTAPTLETYFETDREAREIAAALIG